MAIKPTQDRKTMMWEGQKNTFGLLPGLPSCGGTCANATTEEGGCFYTAPGRKLPTCYVFSKMNFRPAIKALLKHNTDLLVNADSETQQSLFREEFNRFLKADLRKFPEAQNHYYRIHWSGDCPDIRYTENLKLVMEEFPNIRFWGYSRNLFTVPVMMGVANCAWNISLDIVNLETHMAYLINTKCINKDYRQAEHSNIGYSYMSKTNALSDVVFTCPTDVGESDFVGACSRCMNCVIGRNPVYFKTK